MNTIKYCLLTFDVEEWFQVENLKDHIAKNDWEIKETSVLKNTDRILNLLADHDIKATFFILGWVAEKYPSIVQKIQSAGHEIGSHGYGHDLTYSLDTNTIKEDIKKSKNILENILGFQIYGYRAPSFSVDDRLTDLLKEQGFVYDSSFLPFKLNKRYGNIENIKNIEHGIYWLENGLAEVPISMARIGKLNFPAGGGAYFRLFPFPVFRHLVKKIINIQPFYNFYLHPWEFEPEQPRIKSLRLNYKIRHYSGLNKTSVKIKKLIDFLKNNHCKFTTINEYLRIISAENV